MLVACSCSFDPKMQLLCSPFDKCSAVSPAPAEPIVCLKLSLLLLIQGTLKDKWTLRPHKPQALGLAGRQPTQAKLCVAYSSPSYTNTAPLTGCIAQTTPHTGPRRMLTARGSPVNSTMTPSRHACSAAPDAPPTATPSSSTRRARRAKRLQGVSGQAVGQLTMTGAQHCARRAVNGHAQHQYAAASRTRRLLRKILRKQ